MAEITIADTINMVVFRCPSCGVTYGLERAYYDNRYEYNHAYYCPNGHRLSWNKSEADRLREQLDKERARVTEKEQRLEEERRSHAATRGLMTKMRNRVGHGVCPCCNRSFANLRRHMATKHPGSTTAGDSSRMAATTRRKTLTSAASS